MNNGNISIFSNLIFSFLYLFGHSLLNIYLKNGIIGVTVNPITLTILCNTINCFKVGLFNMTLKISNIMATAVNPIIHINNLFVIFFLFILKYVCPNKMINKINKTILTWTGDKIIIID